MRSVLLILFLVPVLSFGQKISGTNKLENTSENKADSKIIEIKKVVHVYKVTGENAGFWIQKGDVIIKKYWKPNDASAVGLELQPGKYQVFPNIENGKKQASVSLFYK